MNSIITNSFGFNIDDESCMSSIGVIAEESRCVSASRERGENEMTMEKKSSLTHFHSPNLQNSSNKPRKTLHKRCNSADHVHIASKRSVLAASAPTTRTPPTCSSSNTSSTASSSSNYSLQNQNERAIRFISSPIDELHTPISTSSRIIPNNSFSSLSNRSLSTHNNIVVSKKKNSNRKWFRVLKPNYKYRSEEFKRFFLTTDSPSNEQERLVVDYSCALQRDILCQGRMYCSVKHLCFHFNIFGIERNYKWKWSDVIAIHKDRTAKIIPNAIRITLASADELFFTTFRSRDKAYTMIWRLWNISIGEESNTLRGKELWSLIHLNYGDNLNLTSDDDDYVSPICLGPFTYKQINQFRKTSHSKKKKRTKNVSTTSAPAKLTLSASVPAFQIEPNTNKASSTSHLANSHKSLHKINNAFDATNDDEISPNELANAAGARFDSASVADDGTIGCESDTTEDEEIEASRKQVPSIPPVTGVLFTDEEYTVSVDQMFILLFSSHDFMKEFFIHKRQFIDCVFNDWMTDKGNNKTNETEASTPTNTLKYDNDDSIDIHSRTLTYKVKALPGQWSDNEERQYLLPQSVSGRLYFVDTEVRSSGVMYCDSFYVTCHYVLSRITDRSCRLRVCGEITFTKKIFWTMKSMIESRVHSTLKEHFRDMMIMLLALTTDKLPKVAAGSHLKDEIPQLHLLKAPKKVTKRPVETPVSKTEKNVGRRRLGSIKKHDSFDKLAIEHHQRRTRRKRSVALQKSHNRFSSRHKSGEDSSRARLIRDSSSSSSSETDEILNDRASFDFFTNGGATKRDKKRYLPGYNEHWMVNLIFYFLLISNLCLFVRYFYLRWSGCDLFGEMFGYDVSRESQLARLDGSIRRVEEVVNQLKSAMHDLKISEES